MKARLKTAVQDVWQYVRPRSIDAPKWVWAYTELREDGLYLVRGADKQQIELGDWLVRDDGAPTWSTDEDFHRQYEIVT